MPYTISATFREKPDRYLGSAATLDEARTLAMALWDGDIWHIHITHKGYISGQLYYYRGWKWNNGKIVRPINRNGSLRGKTQ